MTRRRTRVALAVLFAAACLGGCAGGPRARETVTLAAMGNLLVSASPLAAGDPAATAEARLRRAIDEINASEDVRFVVLLGNLIGDGRPRALDRLKAALAELRKPWYVVLGPEGLAPTPAPGEPPAAADAEGEPTASGETTVGAAFLVWTLRGHGFDGPEPYWAAEVDGGLLLIGLFTAAAGSGRPGHVDTAQLRWLDRTLGEHAGRPAVILAYHALVSFHPFDSTVFWEDRLVGNRDEVLAVLAEHDNVLAVLSASHRFAAGQAVGDVVHLSVPALSSWPLAYDLVRIAPEAIERQYVPVGTDDETRAALDHLAAGQGVRQLFGEGERAIETIVQVFGGRKTDRWNLRTMRP
jgi:hypothetical protein